MFRPLGLSGCEHPGMMGFTGWLDRSFLQSLCSGRVRATPNKATKTGLLKPQSLDKSGSIFSNPGRPRAPTGIKVHLIFLSSPNQALLILGRLNGSNCELCTLPTGRWLRSWAAKCMCIAWYHVHPHHQVTGDLQVDFFEFMLPRLPFCIQGCVGGERITEPKEKQKISSAAERYWDALRYARDKFVFKLFILNEYWIISLGMFRLIGETDKASSRMPNFQDTSLQLGYCRLGCLFMKPETLCG